MFELEDIIQIKNCYINEKFKNYNPKNTNNINIKWIKDSNEFIKNNLPNSFNYDYEIKLDILENSLKLEYNYCIIDCGSHIGDGAIPIVHALNYYGRDDITVYAIDPSIEKCNFINYIKNLNNLSNLEVLNYGLSDKNGLYFPLIPKDKNTGGTCWELNPNLNNENKKFYDKGQPINFIKLDYLVNMKFIKKNIGLIHLDVENMEREALKGGYLSIVNFEPYISLEDHYNIPNSYCEVLNNRYKFKKRILNNSIIIPENNIIYQSDSDGINSISLGKKTNSKGNCSISIGFNSNSNGDRNICLGESSFSNKTTSIAIGYFCKSSNDNSVSIGQKCNSNGSSSICLGYNCKSLGNNCVTIGDSAKSNSDISISIGYNSESCGRSGIAIGDNAKSLGKNSIAIGTNVTSSEDNLVKLGNENSEVKIDGNFIVKNIDIIEKLKFLENKIKEIYEDKN